MQILQVKTAEDFSNVTPPVGSVLLYPQINEDGTVSLHAKKPDGSTSVISGNDASLAPMLEVMEFIADNHSLIVGFDNIPVITEGTDDDGNPTQELPFQAIVIGDGNTYGPGVYMRGNGNTNTLGFVTVTGHNNKTYQFQTFIGDNNDFQTAVNVTVIGNSNKGNDQAYGSLILGDMNTANARFAVIGGYKNTVSARGARVFGRYLTISNDPANEYGFFTGEKEIGFASRVNKKVLNPLYNPTLDTGKTGTDSKGERQYIPKLAFSAQYRGRLTGTTLEVTGASGLVSLDHDHYNRWKITPTAAVIPELENWLDNDEGELIIYNGGSKIQWPAEWNWIGDIPELGTVNIFELKKIDNSIHIKDKMTAGSGNVKSVNNTAPDENGNINVTIPSIEIGNNGNWFIGGVDTGSPARGQTGNSGLDGTITAVLSATEPNASSYPEGAIWIKR